MAIIKNTASQGLYVYAHDTAADVAKTGDAGQITATISKDGSTPAAATNDANPTEIGGGVYWFDLLQAETNAGVLALIPVSSTADVALDPVLVVTDDVAISSRLAPTDAGRTLDILATGEASANVTYWLGTALTSAPATAAEVWTYASRTLTQSAAQVTAAVAGGTVTILRGDTLTASFTGLGDVSGRSKLWWSVKDSYSDPDTSAILQIEETAGLLRINGGTAGTALGSITVTDENTGALTISIDETITDDLTPRNNLYYDVQMLTTAGAVQTLTTGTAHITPDVTRAVA